jgi:hypothetical protein
MPAKSLFFTFLKSIAVALGITLLCLIFLNFPLARQVGLVARYDLLIPLALMFVLTFLVLRIPGIAGQLLAPVYMMLVFALSVSGLWASGTSEQYVLGGTIPFSDSMLYYIDALRFLEGGYVSSISADKPFISSLLSGLLAITHFNWLAALSLMLVLVILAVYLATRELQRTHGAAAASVFFIIIFFYYRRYSGTAMAENLGLCLGLLAFVMLWRFLSHRQPGWLVAGMGVLTLALFSRLGAFLILPLLLAWVVWDITRTQGFQKWRWQSWKTLFLIGLAMLLVVGINRFIVNLIAGPDVISSTQFTVHLYSLVTGGQYWGNLESQHPEILHLSGNAYTLSALQICYSYFVQHPMGLVEGIARNYATYFNDGMRGEYSYIDGAADMVNLAFRVGCFILAAIGLGTLFLRRNRSISLFVGLCTAGMLLSIPLVPPISTYKLRLMAATIWIEALLPALAAAWVISLLPEWVKKWVDRLPAFPQLGAWPAAFFVVLLLLGLIISPVLIRLTAHPTSLPLSTCPAGQKAVVMRAEPGGYIELVDQDDPRQGWVPYIRLAYFKIKIHNLGESAQFPIFEAIKQPTVLIQNLDLLSSGEIMIFAPAGFYSQKPGLVMACGNFLPDAAAYTDDFFFASSLQELNIP